MGSAWQGYAKRNGDKMTLVGYYPLDEDSGTTAYDYSGNENHGTANGAGPSGTGTVAGPLNASAYDFDGTDDRVELPSFPFDKSTPYTVCMWAYVTDYSDDTFMYGKTGPNNQRTDFKLYQGQLIYNFGVRGGNSLKVTDTGIPKNKWLHYAASYDPSGPTLTGYLNGSPIGSTTGSVDQFSTSFGPWIGANSFDDGSGRAWTPGHIQDVRIYDRAISPQEVAYLYQVGQEAHIRTEVKTL
jgi:hypothetical protein